MRNHEEIAVIGSDQIVRRTPTTWTANPNQIYEMRLAPRSRHHPVRWLHEHNLYLYVKKGSALVERALIQLELKEGQFLLIPGHTHYRLQPLDQQAAIIMMGSPSSQVEEDWRSVFVP